MESTISSAESGLPDFTSVLQLTETREIVKTIFYDLHGLMINNDGKYARIAPPLMTFDAVTDIIYSVVYPCANLITSRSTFDEHQIKTYHMHIIKTLGEWFACHGAHRMISPKVWQIITSLEKDQRAEFGLYKELNGKQEVTRQHNAIMNKYKIKWNYHKELYEDLLIAVKNEYGLDSEQFGKDTRITKTLISISFMIHGAMNRSLNATYLNHEKQTHKETQTFTQAEDKTENSGFFDKLNRTSNSGYGGVQ